jgi:hypothetical protein
MGEIGRKGADLSRVLSVVFGYLPAIFGRARSGPQLAIAEMAE